MSAESIRVEKFIKTNCKRYRYWLIFRKPCNSLTTKQDRKTFIDFIQNILGPIGNKWQYQKQDFGNFILKIDSEQDALFLLLKYKST